MSESTTIDETAEAGLIAGGDPEVEQSGENNPNPVRPFNLRWPTVPQILVAIALSTWTWYFTKRSLDIHHSLGTSSYDSGLYDQGIWLLSRFDAPFVTLMGRNLLGDHTSLVLLFLVPL